MVPQPGILLAFVPSVNLAAENLHSRSQLLKLPRNELMQSKSSATSNFKPFFARSVASSDESCAKNEQHRISNAEDFVQISSSFSRRKCFDSKTLLKVKSEVDSVQS
jgi:hypothetical protein